MQNVLLKKLNFTYSLDFCQHGNTIHVEARVFISLFLKPLVFKCLKLSYLYIDSCAGE